MMNDKGKRQKQLIEIKNYCAELSSIIERLYESPSSPILTEIIKTLADKLQAYIRE